MSDHPSFKAHLFVCTNDKGKGESCGPKHAKHLRDCLKERLKADPQTKGKVRINASGCLGECKHGIAAVLYPKGQWFTDLHKNDDEILYQAVLKALKE